MSSFAYADGRTGLSTRIPDTEIGQMPLGAGSWGRMRLPDDAIGNTTVTFRGVAAGSEIHIYLPDGTELVGTESCTANQALTWPVYPVPNNTVYITIIKRGYRWMKFNYDSVLGDEALPVFQIADLGYSNPA